MAGAIQPYSGPVPAAAYGPPRQAPAAVASPDQVAIGSDTTDDHSTKVLNLRLQLDSKLFKADANGHVPLDDLTPVLVGANGTGVMPQVLAASPEEQAPDGEINVAAVIPVAKQLVDSGDVAAYTAELVAPGSHVVKDDDYRMNLNDARQIARSTSRPLGMSTEVAPSTGGKLAREGGNLGARLFSDVLGTPAASSLAGLLHFLPTAAAGPLALVAAPLQMFGPQGEAYQIGDLLDSKNHLQTLQDDGGQTTVPYELGANGKLVGSLQENDISTLQGDIKAQQRKTITQMTGSGLLGLAGGAALIGGTVALAAPALAVGSVVVPMVGVFGSQMHAMKNLNDREAELKKLLAMGQSTIKQNQPMLNDAGQQVAIQRVDVPIAGELVNIAHAKKSAILGMTATAVGVGSVAAMALGAPIMIAMAAMAIPAAVGMALFPKESWDMAKSIPGRVVDTVEEVGHWAGHAIHHLFSSDSDKAAAPVAPTAAPPPATPATAAYQQILGHVSEVDGELGHRLAKSLEMVNSDLAPDQLAEATATCNMALQDLKSEAPALYKRFVKAHDGMQAEQKANELVALNAVVTKSLAEPKAQATLKSPQVQACLSKNGLSQDDAQQLMGTMLRAALTRDPSELNTLEAAAKSGDAHALAMTDLVAAIGAGQTTSA